MRREDRDKYFARVGHANNDLRIWGQYERLVDFIFEKLPESGKRFEEFPQPLLFLLSHSIELALKENIKFFRRYSGSHLTKFENLAMLIKSHDLDALSQEFKIAFIRLHKTVNGKDWEKKEFFDYYSSLTELIGILKRNTETYRYAFKIDNHGNTVKRSIEFDKVVDFYVIQTLHKQVNTLFIGAANTIGIYTDYIDFKLGNPQYKKGKGSLYVQRLFYTQDYIEVVTKAE